MNYLPKIHLYHIYFIFSVRLIQIVRSVIVNEYFITVFIIQKNPIAYYPMATAIGVPIVTKDSYIFSKCNVNIQNLKFMLSKSEYRILRTELNVLSGMLSLLSISRRPYRILPELSKACLTGNFSFLLSDQLNNISEIIMLKHQWELVNSILTNNIFSRKIEHLTNLFITDLFTLSIRYWEIYLICPNCQCESIFFI